MNFFRFPHTPHLDWLGEGTPRDDKVLSPSEVETILSQSLIVEEKVDGANIGISISVFGELQVQNRGQYLMEPFDGQFEKLNTWLPPRYDHIFDALGEDLILFGEWCAARHSIFVCQSNYPLDLICSLYLAVLQFSSDKPSIIVHGAIDFSAPRLQHVMALHMRTSSPSF